MPASKPMVAQVRLELVIRDFITSMAKGAESKGANGVVRRKSSVRFVRRKRGGMRHSRESLRLAHDPMSLKYAESENVGGFVGSRSGTIVRSLIECLGRNVVDCR